MNNRNKFIPNPNKLSLEEVNFLASQNIPPKQSPKKTYKGRMISMSDDFYKELNNFLAANPTEGNRSSFIVRVVAEYIKNR
jgi:hypothetical protein